MTKSGPIIIIEDDVDDQEILTMILQKLGVRNEVIYFKDGESALEFLTDSSRKPFLVISDVNMPKMNGLELRERIYNNELLSLRCVPFLFFTTGVTDKEVIAAYSLSAQGFFKKPTSTTELQDILKSILNYWSNCIAPFESLN